MITKQQKKDWIAALRSGDYKQNAGQLYKPSTDSYCCLGVLNAINDNNLSSSLNYLDDDVLSYDTQVRLSAMNDIQGKSFSEIADWIEEHINDN